jgi:CheY-like chemotaxis protein
MLIADDDPLIVKMLADRCAGVGFDIDTATNGVQALIKANRSHPDIMVIDVNMPEADGLTVCARLLESSRKSMNVVVVTGSRDTETVERCDAFGAYYVRKGPKFWSSLAAALTALFPAMADRIRELDQQPMRIEMRERPRVLVIGDDPAMKQFLASRLDKCGLEPLFVPDATQGFRMACRESPSVIITDYLLPNGGVPYLMSRLRTTPDTENVPVFVLTGIDLGGITEQSLMREVCGKPGVSRIFKKSFDTDALFAALQKICGFEHHRVNG